MPVFRLAKNIAFPSRELAEPDGLLAIGGDLSPARLLAAYHLGIFPWYAPGDPILWWTPAPRLVLFPEEFHLSRSLARLIRKNVFAVTSDQAFRQVMEHCASFRSRTRTETWINQDMIEAYCLLYRMGFAHSIECWQGTSLAGGLYGIALGRVFFGESMFASVSGASKVAMHALVQHARSSGIELIDCQMRTEHLVRMGAREIAREEFQNLLELYANLAPPRTRWRLDINPPQHGGRQDTCRFRKKE